MFPYETNHLTPHSSMSCIQKVKGFIIDHGLIRENSRVIAAVSGGSDSMALLTILKEIEGELGFTLAAAHFNHGIRSASAREKKLVEEYVSSLKVPLLVGSGDVPYEAAQRRTGIEETARTLRYRFFEETAEEWGADHLALGHTRDDQIETVLHHILRGSGWRGITGMPVRRGAIIRPLLTCSRRELLGFLRGRRIRYADDESNRNNRLLRNRIRNRLLPYLRKNFNPSIDDSIIRLQANAAEGWEALERPLGKEIPEKDSRDRVSVPVERLRCLTDFQIYLFVDLVLRERFGVLQDIEKCHFDAAKRLVRSGRSGSRIIFPHGIELVREQKDVVISRVPPRGTAATHREELVMTAPGVFRLPSRGLEVELRVLNRKGIEPGPPDEREAYLASVEFPVRLRSRRAGDRMVPFGMDGRKKLSDIFIDRKVPLTARDRIPVFEDPKGIFWVPGVAADERTRIRKNTRRVLHLKLSYSDE